MQTALSFTSSSAFSVSNATTDIVVNTGFYRVFSNQTLVGTGLAAFDVTDGASTKRLIKFEATTGILQCIPIDFIVFLKAGDILQAVSSSANTSLVGNTRQIADINGNLVNPL